MATSLLVFKSCHSCAFIHVCTLSVKAYMHLRSVSKTPKRNTTNLDYVQLALHEKDSDKGVIMFSTINRDVGIVHSMCSYVETPKSGKIRNKEGCCIPLH